MSTRPVRMAALGAITTAEAVIIEVIVATEIVVDEVSFISPAAVEQQPEAIEEVEFIFSNLSFEDEEAVLSASFEEPQSISGKWLSVPGSAPSTVSRSDFLEPQ